MQCTHTEIAFGKSYALENMFVEQRFVVDCKTKCVSGVARITNRRFVPKYITKQGLDHSTAAAYLARPFAAGNHCRVDRRCDEMSALETTIKNFSRERPARS